MTLLNNRDGEEHVAAEAFCEPDSVTGPRDTVVSQMDGVSAVFGAYILGKGGGGIHPRSQRAGEKRGWGDGDEGSG